MGAAKTERPARTRTGPPPRARQALVQTVPTLLNRQGDFSDLRSSAGQPVVVYDPVTRLVTVLDSGTDIARFDLAVFVSESEAGWLVNWVYNAELFEAATIDAMCRRYERLLQSILENRDASLEELEMLSETEKQRLQEVRNERLQAQSLRLRSMRRKAIDLSSSNEKSERPS